MNYLGILACIAPIYYINYAYKNDRTEKEPIGLLFKLFVFGALSVIPISIVETTISYLENYISSDFFVNLFDAFIVAGLTEEGFKFLFLKLGSFKHKNFDTSYDGIIYAVMVSMGFAIVENILYCVDSGFSTVVVRSILSIPAHCAFAVIMGIYYARAKRCFNYGAKEAYSLNMKKAFICPALFHGLFDFCLMEQGYFLYVFIVVMIIVYRQLFKVLKANALNDRNI